MTKIHIYASGSGALNFVRCDDRGRACPPHNITMEEAKRTIIERGVKGYDYSAFKLVENRGEPILIPDVTYNKQTQIASYDGHLFHRINGAWYGCTPGGNEWHVVHNYSMLAALRFWESNSELYKPTMAEA